MSLARRTVHGGRARQLSLIGEGMLADDAPLEDVFALWAERVADLNAAIAEHEAAQA